jgi:hypothetical protein
LRRWKIKNPNVTDQEIAAKVKVNVTHSVVDTKVLDRELEELKVIRVSPLLLDRIGLDNITFYEYWQDTGQESIHLRFMDPNPSEKEPKAQFVRWMKGFRSRVPGLIKVSIPERPAAK